MRKVAVYAGTRNVYPSMIVAAKSLLRNTRMDRVWFLTEDDEFPEPLPEVIRVMNVSGQGYFPREGPNYGTPWSYMTLMRCALANLFPEERRMLWLDVDTIVDGDITELMQTDLDGFCFAGVPEPHKSRGVFRYINAGVLLCNLDMIRRTGKADEIIWLINLRKLEFPDQDAINLLSQGYIRAVGGEWNVSDYTERGNGRRIIHYAARSNREAEPEYRRYASLEWPE